MASIDGTNGPDTIDAAHGVTEGFDSIKGYGGADTGGADLITFLNAPAIDPSDFAFV